MTSAAIAKAAVWLPSQTESCESIASASGLPVHVVRDKMGIKKKYRAAPDMHPSEMAIRASRKVLVGVDPDSVDVVIWTGSEYKDHIVWSAGIFVQESLGLRKAYAFDIGARCSTGILGLRLASDMMRARPEIKRILLCGGHKTGDLVNYRDPNTRFLYNLADGGSAVLVERSERNPLLESAIITDGRFSKDVIVPAGGTVKPLKSAFVSDDSYLQVPDVEGMRNRLAECSIQNFVRVIRDAGRASMPHQSIDYLALLHMKRSAHDEILQHCELQERQSIYLDEFGHIGSPDQVLSVGLAEAQGLLKPGAHVVMAAAGIGYTWSAISFRWDNNVFDQNLF